jgi:septum formation inhibitor-activating ATPase MinD
MTHIMADMAETMNEVLALVSSLLKEIDCLNVTRDDQDVINTLVAGQIITLDERLRQAMADYDVIRRATLTP